MQLVIGIKIPLLKQLVGCDWYLAWCDFRVRRLEEVDIEIPDQETSPEHKVLVLDFFCEFLTFLCVFVNGSVFLSLCACEFYYFKSRG